MSLTPPTGSTPRGHGLMGWLGRQIGYVAKAVRQPVDGTPSPGPVPPAAPQTVYRQERVEERPHPDRPDITLRRTVVDEAVQRGAAGPRERD